MITEGRLRAVILGCGVLLVLLGLLQGLLKLPVDPQVEHWVGTGILLVAALCWVQLIQLRRRQARERQAPGERP